jgi:competence protein ComEC
MSRTAAAFADDCTRAALIVTLRAAPADCAAKVVDRSTLRANGAMALTYRNGHFEAVSSRPEGLDRPWTRRREVARNTATPSVGASAAPPTSRDATPLQPDMETEE